MFLAVCFTECRKNGWTPPEPLLAAMESHLADLLSAGNINDARSCLGVGVALDGSEDQYRQAIWQANDDNLIALFDDLQSLGFTRRNVQIRMIAGFTGRTYQAIKQHFYRLRRK